MEPTDQPPPQEQLWPQTPPWQPGPEPTPTTSPESEVALQAAAESSATQAPPPSTRIIAERPTLRWLVLAAALTELVAITGGNNQWVAKKAINYADGPQNGFAHQFVFATQTFAWRLTKHSGESASQWAAPLVGIGVVLALTALLVAFLIRRGSFWRAAAGSFLIVVFSTQVAGVVSGLVYGGPRYIALSGLEPPPSNDGVTYWGASVNGTLPGGGKATRALFDSPTGYRFVAGLTLGVLVATVVGVVARRFGAGPRLAQSVSQSFFPPGEMQRSYESGAPGLAQPGSVPPPPTLQGPGGGRHSRTE